MTDYYLIRGNQLISTIDSDASDVVAMPLFCGGDAMSLLSGVHVQALMTSQGWTVEQALTALGLADLRSSMLKSICLTKDPASLAVTGVIAYHIVDVGNYGLYQCDAQQDDLLTLHSLMWAETPTESLGLLAVVQTFGSEFYPAAVRTAAGMTVEQALARRDKIATYLEGLGYENTDELRAATDEDAQMVGIATALGYTETQLWAAMVE